MHWTESFHPRIGGMEVFVRHLVAAQRERGHACEVITSALPGAPDVERIDGCAVHRLPFHRALAARSLPMIRSVQEQAAGRLAAFEPDVVHLHTSQASAFFLMRISRGRPMPIVYTAHDGFLAPLHSVPTSLLGSVLAGANRVVAPSDFVARALAASFPDSRGALVRIHGSLPAPAEPKQCAPHDVAAAPTVARLVALGRLTRDKGFDTLLDALARIGPDTPAWRAEIAGDGPEATRLRALIAHFGLESRVRLCGWTAPDVVPTWLGSAAMLVVPSRWQEPFGLVALQAMQCGIPVIASRVGGLPEIVAEGVSGLLVEPDDPPALAAAIDRLLRDADARGRMGMAAKARAESAFAWEDLVVAYETIYEDLRH